MNLQGSDPRGGGGGSSRPAVTLGRRPLLRGAGLIPASMSAGIRFHAALGGAAVAQWRAGPVCRPPVLGAGREWREVLVVGTPGRLGPSPKLPCPPGVWAVGGGGAWAPEHGRFSLTVSGRRSPPGSPAHRGRFCFLALRVLPGFWCGGGMGLGGVGLAPSPHLGERGGKGFCRPFLNKKNSPGSMGLEKPGPPAPPDKFRGPSKDPGPPLVVGAGESKFCM